MSTSPARRGAGLGLISPHTYERGDPHTNEFGSLEPESIRTREPDSYVYGPPKNNAEFARYSTVVTFRVSIGSSSFYHRKAGLVETC
jgi:hypothetical protein